MTQSQIVDPASVKSRIFQLNRPVYLIENAGIPQVSADCPDLFHDVHDREPIPIIPTEDRRAQSAYAPAFELRNLGDAGFCDDYGLTYPYLVGAMANGITSSRMTEAIGKSGMLAFFGSAGLSPHEIEGVIDYLSARLSKRPYGFNLIHSPDEPQLEARTVDLYLRKDVRLVSASAYLNITRSLARYRIQNIHRDEKGRIVAPNRIIAKVSRAEVAAYFFSPPPDRLLQNLVAHGEITSEQAQLASQIPMAQDLTAEADSGGHTDNRPALALLPTIIALRDRMQAKYNYSQPLRVGIAGGIATPIAAGAGFAMGAAYILTGSVNQACVEAGTSETVRQMLAETKQADVTMAPAADMFEMGVKVQVLKRGTMFAMRGTKLYEIYRKYDSVNRIPTTERDMIEKKIFHRSFDEVWRQTSRYFQERDVSRIHKAEKNPKYKMALIFRWYLGQASHWANRGEASRKIDYQIWCGPAMGAFNEWTRGSFLEKAENRDVVTVAMNLLYGAGLTQRLQLIRSQGVQLPPEMRRIKPLPISEIKKRIA
ncbi:MAG: 2-nitropropane dioxygenase [Candidatus Cloacimonetes bacterium 4572_55]|nr:MAG: 2-nitropropane dioxygenase [Candidatus Cloacimonetes bacterium 4572_55]